MAERHLSSLLVHAVPERIEEVSNALLHEGCEVHTASAAGKLVVTLEGDELTNFSETITRIQLLPGVLAATLVFHHFEPDAEEALP